MKKRLITSALPYVNNIPHLGNLVQVLSADVFARFCRLRGYKTLYICGTDEYGTASETRAIQEGTTPKALCDKYYKVHKDIYNWFNISFDNFGRTSYEKHTEIVQDIFKKLDNAGYITEKESEQLYCPHCNRFLADRFVKGTCPHCNNIDARGDQCESCGKLLDPTDLIEPKCSVCSNTPIIKKTKNLYLNLPKLSSALTSWVDKTSIEGFWSKNAVTITNSWIKNGLEERCITRDLKWGIPVNKEGFREKVFYVWFDACIGYISITAEKFSDWQEWWKSPEDTELFQFIGKDNIPFHTVVFPSTMLGTGEKWTMLHHMSSTEYLNYEGGKFSKSKGVGIFGNDVEQTGIAADIWRFYIFYNRPEKADYTFSWADFQEKTNKELIGNLSNLVNRTLTFVERFYNGKIERDCVDEKLKERIIKEEEKITSLLEKAELKDALHLIMRLADIGNKEFQEREPWKLRNADPEATEELLNTLLFLIRDIAIMVYPYIPSTASAILSYMGIDNFSWSDVRTFKGSIFVSNTKILFTKLEDEKITELRNRYSGLQKEVSMEEENIKERFSKEIILKVSKVVNVERHSGGDKLYILHLDCGEENERVIVSSIVPYYKEEELLGRNIVLVSNLKPANFRGVKSCGMLLAASEEGDSEHLTCEVIFADDIPVGTVLKYEGEEDTEKKDTYLKAEAFFSIPLKTIDGFVTVAGKKIGYNGHYLKVSKYINGDVG